MSTNTTVETSMQQKLKLDDQLSQIKLVRLTLENFKGVTRFTLEPDGKDIAVLGDNAAGKTTLADGFSWLLFGKDSQGRADFEIKTLSATGEAVHGLEHSVEAVLSIGTFRLELRKVHREKWTKKRGSAEKEFTGHTRDHFINGVPVTQSEYESQVAATITTEEISKLLTNPIHFAERLHWQERRKKLLEVCGDISDVEVIESSRDLADLAGILDGRSIDDHRKVAQAQRRKINEELQRVPVRIDEVNRGLPDIEGDEDALKGQVSGLRNHRADIELERSRIQSGGEIAEKTKRIREIESELIDERNRQKSKAGESVGELRTQVSRAQQADETNMHVLGRLESEIEETEHEADSLESLMAGRRELWHQIDSQGFSPQPGNDVCAACGQNLPADHVKDASEKAEAAFNAEKARQLQEIAEEGKRFRARHGKLETVVKLKRKVIEGCKKDAEKSQRKLDELKLQIAEHEDKPIMASVKEPELEAAKAELETEIAELRRGTEKALSAVDEELEALNAEIIEAETQLNKISQRESGEERIKQLKADERRLASNYEELERQLYLIEEFTRQKVTLLTDQINSHFELARFKLFDTLVNGGVDECCEVTYGGVPWGSLNSGAQINIGLDVIRTLSKHHGISPPIFIDHAESVTQLLETPGQQIRLAVSAEDGSLRVEEVTQ